MRHISPVSILGSWLPYARVSLLDTSLDLDNERTIWNVQRVPNLVGVLWGLAVISKTTIFNANVNEVSILRPQIQFMAIVGETGAAQAMVPLAGPISPTTSIDKEIRECVMVVW